MGKYENILNLDDDIPNTKILMRTFPIIEFFIDRNPISQNYYRES